jgi:hypothetical protein
MTPPYEKRLLKDHLIEGVTLEMLSMVPMNPVETKPRCSAAG